MIHPSASAWLAGWQGMLAICSVGLPSLGSRPCFPQSRDRPAGGRRKTGAGSKNKGCTAGSALPCPAVSALPCSACCALLCSCSPRPPSLAALLPRGQILCLTCIAGGRIANQVQGGGAIHHMTPCDVRFFFFLLPLCDVTDSNGSFVGAQTHVMYIAEYTRSTYV